MVSSLNAILGMRFGTPYAHQNSVQATGANIAKADTGGYSRQGVRYQTNPSPGAYSGQIGQVTEVSRTFNQFVEKAYISKISDASRWSEQFDLLCTVDALVHESDAMPGIAAALNRFFEGWQTVSDNGTLVSSRETLISDAETLACRIREQSAALTYMQNRMDGLIQADVDRANQLMKDLADLNCQINPDGLPDQRDLKARQLAEIIDIETTDRGEGHYTITTKSGLPLVGKGNHYALEFDGPQEDRLDTLPKPDIYWKRPAGEERISIVPKGLSDGTGNIHRTTGGRLTAYFEFRDPLLGGYKDRLDIFASALSREANRIQTFFMGEGAADFGVHADIVKNLNMVAAAAINVGDEGNSGDIVTAPQLSRLAAKKLDIVNPSTGKTSGQTLPEVYSAYAAIVGEDTRTAKYNSSLFGAMASDLKKQQDSNSGANIDEEMDNLFRFQNAYKAVAKLVTTADEMLQAILGLKSQF